MNRPRFFCEEGVGTGTASANKKRKQMHEKSAWERRLFMGRSRLNDLWTDAATSSTWPIHLVRKDNVFMSGQARPRACWASIESHTAKSNVEENSFSTKVCPRLCFRSRVIRILTWYIFFFLNNRRPNLSFTISLLGWFILSRKDFFRSHTTIDFTRKRILLRALILTTSRVHNVYHFLSNSRGYYDVPFSTMTGKLHVKCPVKDPLPAMFCIGEDIDGGRRKQWHLLKSTSSD
jgi:hypothetical protein